MALRIHQTGWGSLESFGPFSTYMLSRGLVVRLNKDGAVVRGGSGSEITLTTDATPDEFDLLTPEVYAELVDRAQSQVGANLVGAASPDGIPPEVYGDLFDGLPPEFVARLSDPNARPPSEVLFKVGDRAISAGWMGEELLGRFLVLENLVRATALKFAGISESAFRESQEIVAVLDDAILEGRIGPEMIDAIIESASGTPAAMTAAFFVSNSVSIADDVRLAVLAACHHLATLNSGILSINEKGPLRPPTPVSGNGGWEIRQISEEADRLSFS